MPMQNDTNLPSCTHFPIASPRCYQLHAKTRGTPLCFGHQRYILVTDHIHARLLNHTNVVSRLKSILALFFTRFPMACQRSTRAVVQELLSCGRLERGGRGPVTCIIADGLMSFVCDVANELGISIFYTRTLSPCSLSVFFSLPKLIQAGELPFSTTGDDLDNQLKVYPEWRTFSGAVIFLTFAGQILSPIQEFNSSKMRTKKMLALKG
ncbi:hypothetical protein AG4045_020732 [Apium graveolens]|uniref:Uncharacterized protein n=1 Tax=Apium graveolens TaxID=4045 RepID=A0A6L5B808_APIGR|nr:hypothetical protein AG4045_020732 [Apium graveolens]